MALFKILRGASADFHNDLSLFQNWDYNGPGTARLKTNTAITLSPKFNDGFCYFLKDTKMFYIDYAITNAAGQITERHRVPLNAEDSQKLTGAILNRTALTSSEDEIPSSKVLFEEFARVDTELVTLNTLCGTKMNKENPTGSGALSINRKANTTTGTKSVAIGNNNTASGTSSFAEGDTTTASGVTSHSEGTNSVAAGAQSHAQNLYTIANGVAQTAIGKYNIADTTSAFIIGNGTSNTARNNAFTIDWNGNAYTASRLNIGNKTNTTHALYVNGTGFFTGVVKGVTPVAAEDLTTKAYVDTSIATLNVSMKNNIKLIRIKEV